MWLCTFVQNWNFAFFKTFRFSSGVLPAGTISAGRLGKVYNFSKSSAASASAVSANFLLSLYLEPFFF
jgi:hypothetical protein